MFTWVFLNRICSYFFSVIVIILTTFLYLLTPLKVLAIYDPLSIPNNKIGVHILFTDEVEQASKYINQNGQGEYGYVTIPIQSTDRNRVKWQDFFDKCDKFKIIPIIRIATFPEGSNWAKPNNFDLIDFANFLNDLKWPTANRYVIIFNEVNRSDEYGGSISPEQYSDILKNAVMVFKERSSEFFILPSALDNAASNSISSLNHRLYLERMYLRHPDIFDLIDGYNSHAYPNPAFSAPPNQKGKNKINSYESDLGLIKKFTSKKLPIFITETGWSEANLTPKTIDKYYQYALENVWTNPNIVAITPFLFHASTNPFSLFSFTSTDGQLKSYAKTFFSYTSKGEIHKSESNTPPTVKTNNTNSPPYKSSLLNHLIGLYNQVIHSISQIK